MLVDPSSVRERFLKLRDMQFCLCEWGPSEGPLVLILHGWLDQGATWNQVARILAAHGLHVMAIDQRGHGRSAHTPAGTSYHFAEYLADLDALLRTSGKPIQVLVGHSMGGTVASLYAGLRPEKVSQLVLVEGIGPPLVSEEEAVDQLRTYLDHQERSWTQKPLGGVADAARRLRRFNPSLPEDEALWLAQRSTVEREGDRVWSWDAHHRSRSATAYDAGRHRACLARIQAEVCFVQGSRSWYLGISDLDQRLAAIPGEVQRIQLDAGHALHLDRPAELAEIIWLSTKRN